MSITNLKVTNFQSLKNIDLELGLFTVIVGPSSSGKSALIRAFRALASNVRGAGVITRGQKVMAITARTETHTVTLERTERSGTYKLSTDEGQHATYTKLAGEVPGDVTGVLRIEPVGPAGSVNFASQFDKPYLLDESGATVATVLGELTNVSKIFEAVRSANRIRSNAASTLRTRKNDLADIKTRLADFKGLRARMEALYEADEVDARRQEIEALIDGLNTTVRKLRVAEAAIAKTELPEVPSDAGLVDAYNRYGNLKVVVDRLIRLRNVVPEAERDVQMWTEEVARYQHEFDLALRKAGACPTCGRPAP